MPTQAIRDAVKQANEEVNAALKKEMKEAREAYKRECWEIQSRYKAAIGLRVQDIVANSRPVRVLSSLEPVTLPWVDAAVYDPTESTLEDFLEGKA